MIFAILWLLVVAAFGAGYYAGIGHHEKDIEELRRWQIYWHDTRAWLAEFHDAADSLDHLNEVARGQKGANIDRVREAMRRRRDAKK